MTAAESELIQTDQADEEILVVGTRSLAEITPERELDELGVESYGESTIFGLVSELQIELGEEEPPLILVNGERVGTLEDIGSLPVEALSNVRILPRGSAVRAGGRAGQRVVSLTLKKQVRSATALVAPRISTDGAWSAIRGEGILTYIRGSTRANVSISARNEDELLESDRDIEQPAPTPAFALGGNVVGFPDMTGEIDPLLSAAAGELVTVAPIPANDSPTLVDFLSDANQAAVTDLGRFRTLRPKSGNYDLNGTYSTRLAPWLTGTVGVRLGRSTRQSQRGLPQALFVLSPTNASSPFSTTVALAEYGTRPLRTRSERNSGEANLSFNGRFGQWTSFFTGRLFQATDDTRTERRASPQTIFLDDSVDAFGANLFDLVEFDTDRARARTRIFQSRLSATGPLFQMPAGNVQATIEGQYLGTRLRSRSGSPAGLPVRSFERGETSLRGAIDLPLTSLDGFGDQIGNLNATAEYARVHYSDAGDADNYELGLVWEPHPVLRLSAQLEEVELPAAVQLLGNPVIVTSGVRAFDPLTGDTVDVTQITGGNPELHPEKTIVHRIGATVRPLQLLNLQLNAEYIDTRERNFVSALPEASAAVMQAFPDRFIRDVNGVLTIVDLRPVNFDEHHEKRLQYGFSLTRIFDQGAGRAGRMAGPADDDGETVTDDGVRAAVPLRRGPRTRLSLTAQHSIVFKDDIFIRPGLPDVDLLDGGAIGLAGGRVRHQLDGIASISAGGTGLRINASWRGKSKLNAITEGSADSLFFSPVLNVSLRAFADLHRFVGNADWARRMRVSLNVVNATNDRQEVRDSAGNTPLRYQAGYRDPLGRTVELEIRKVF